MHARRHLFASLAPFVVVLAACSGSLSPIGSGSSGDVDGGATIDDDAATSSSSSSSSSGNSSSGGADAGGTKDSGIDGSSGGVTVNEKPAPICHDLTQHGTLVTPVGVLAQAPAQVPIATITPGLYVLISATDYGGAEPIAPVSSSMTTVVFTPTRQYYLSETDTGFKQTLTLDWKIANNRISRTVLCAQQDGQIGNTVDYRIDGAPNGFIVYVPTNGGGPPRLHAYRYKLLP